MHRLLTEAPGFEDCKRDEPFRDTEAGIPSPIEFLQARKSPLNPHWFPLGTMIIYLLLGIKLLLAPVLTMSLQDSGAGRQGALGYCRYRHDSNGLFAGQAAVQ